MSKEFTKETTGREVVAEFPDKVKGKTIVVTGAGENGLGAETAIALAHGAPAHLILLARSQARVDSVISQIKQIDPSIKVDFVVISLDNFDSVRTAAATINSLISKLDYLINNAGIMNIETYSVNKQGYELQFATNHLGHFLFTKLLLPKILAAGAGARVINLTSSAYDLCSVLFDDYNFADGKDYNGWAAYGQSKAANILFSRSLAQGLKSKGIQSYSVHPGVIFSTSLSNHIEDIMASIQSTGDVALKYAGVAHDPAYDTIKPIDQGTASTLIAALDPRIEAESGGYIADSAVRETNAFSGSLENAEKLWKLSEQLVGEKFEL